MPDPEESIFMWCLPNWIIYSVLEYKRKPWVSLLTISFSCFYYKELYIFIYRELRMFINVIEDIQTLSL